MVGVVHIISYSFADTGCMSERAIDYLPGTNGSEIPMTKRYR